MTYTYIGIIFILYIIADLVVGTAGCPVGWSLLEGQCYKLAVQDSGLQAIAVSASNLCDSIGGHLGLVTSQAVADLVEELANTTEKANVSKTQLCLL